MNRRKMRKSWIKYARSNGDLSVVAGDQKRYERGIAAGNRARKRREAAIKAAKTRREKVEASRRAEIADSGGR